MAPEQALSRGIADHPVRHLCAVSFAPLLLGAPTSTDIEPTSTSVVLGDVCQEIILFVAAVISWKSLSGLDSLSQRAARLVRWTFGICLIDFGLAHLTAVWTVVPMIPKWMPFGATFWAVLTGIAFVLAGAAVVSGVLDVLAARLLGLMLLVFSALALAPLIFSSPRDHASWGAQRVQPDSDRSGVDRRRVARRPTTASPE